MGKKSISAVLVLSVAIGIYAYWRFVIDGGNSGPPTIRADITSVTDARFIRDDS